MPCPCWSFADAFLAEVISPTVRASAPVPRTALEPIQPERPPPSRIHGFGEWRLIAGPDVKEVPSYLE
jgi:hypothetical protein